MRYTPFLDSIGVKMHDTFTSEQTDHLVNVLDSALCAVSDMVDWGEWQGRKRKPCPEQPLLLAGQPLGQYHCPVCGEMQLAGVRHLPPDEDYEDVMGRDWPSGYFD